MYMKEREFINEEILHEMEEADAADAELEYSNESKLLAIINNEVTHCNFGLCYGLSF